MPTEDEMTLDERRKYLKRVKPRSMKAKRGERSALLSEKASQQLLRTLHSSNREVQIAQRYS